VTHPYDWAIGVSCSTDVSGSAGTTRISTPVGPSIDVAYKYLRPILDE